MPEEMNIEVAHRLGEHATKPTGSGREELLEIIEAVVLAVVAVATAWSGYEAAKWDGQQALLYGTATRLRIEAGVAATEGGQQRLLDVLDLQHLDPGQGNGRGQARGHFRPQVQRRVPRGLRRLAQDRPVYQSERAGRAALRAPVPQRPASLAQANQVNKAAAVAFAEGTAARETSENYVRSTVLFAIVLFLIALSQRFKLRQVRVGLLFVAAGVMIFALASVANYPRL